MTKKHTPGPWHLSAAKDCIWHQDHGRICTPPNHAQVWNWEPNARLIAAAPELLAALEAWQAVCDRIVDQYDGVVAGVDFAALGRANRAAIAKAKGEQQ
ncbi:hypothetical protein [Achromobacter xylosoxidans]|uniref:hypothetical protein n=1 Tax=Alcaligenes xylosoxydans xylosoxydans TaxID=85698 RepID=UPI001F13D638|nr:hypothetical protein [Achromobacter xylosoxidans]